MSSILFLLSSAKLRARQKERLARRNAVDESSPTDRLLLESAPQCPSTNAEDGEQASGLVQSSMEKPLIIDLEEKFEAPKSKTESPLRLGKLSKSKISSHLDRSVNFLDHPSPDIFLPSHQHPGTNYTNSTFTNNLLPVLGLCAPNANQMESSRKKNFSRSNGRQNRSGAGPEFPFSLAPPSGTLTETEVNVETITNRMKLSDASQDVSQQHHKSGIPDSRLPLSLVLLLLSVWVSLY